MIDGNLIRSLVSTHSTHVACDWPIQGKSRADFTFLYFRCIFEWGRSLFIRGGVSSEGAIFRAAVGVQGGVVVRGLRQGTRQGGLPEEAGRCARAAGRGAGWMRRGRRGGAWAVEGGGGARVCTSRIRTRAVAE
jgi:hypothetical protein